MAMTWLPRSLRWMFRGLAVLAGVLFAAALILAWIDPQMPGRGLAMDINLMGEPKDLPFQNQGLALQFAKHGFVSLQVNNASMFMSAFMWAILPGVLLWSLYCCGLFEVMARLFRNVEKGQCFTPQSLRYVQVIGFSLLVFFLIDAAASGWRDYFFLDFISRHGEPQIASAPMKLPSGEVMNFPIFKSGRPLNVKLESAFDWSYLFAGLLVLALSEVFRQGMKLKKDSELTI